MQANTIHKNHYKFMSNENYLIRIHVEIMSERLEATFFKNKERGYDEGKRVDISWINFQFCKHVLLFCIKVLNPQTYLHRTVEGFKGHE